jgi:Rrf2 family protein
MLSFSQTTGYAILALGCIGSGEGRRVQSEEIQGCSGVPMPYLRKILYSLGKAGLVQTKRGHLGGFVLARPADQITLMDVLQAVEGSDGLPDCLLRLPGCSDETPCPFRSFWKEKRAEIEAFLRRVTVAEAAGPVRAADGSLTCCLPANLTPTERRAGPAGRQD